MKLSIVVPMYNSEKYIGKCLLEAMICGKCVIATNSRGPSELIEDNKNGFLFDIGDIESTRKSIENLYLDKKLSKNFEEKAIDTANNYLLDNVLNQLGCVYKDLYREKEMLLGEII